MKHLNNFSQYNEEHIYGKAIAKDSKNWEANYKKFIDYVKKMIEERQIRNFKNSDSEMTFTAKGRRYKLDKNNKICIYKDKNNEEVELELNPEQYKDLVKALKKPLVSPRAAEPTFKNPEGRKPYLKEDEE